MRSAPCVPHNETESFLLATSSITELIMENLWRQYCDRFNEDVMTIGMPLSAEELWALFAKALKEDKPIDWQSLIGYDPNAPLPEGIVY